MYFTKQLAPFFTEKEEDPKDYLEMLEIINRIQLFLKQNPTIYRCNDVRNSTIIKQYVPSINIEEENQKQVINIEEPRSASVIIDKLNELDTRIKNRIKDLFKIEKDTIKKIESLPTIQVANKYVNSRGKSVTNSPNIKLPSLQNTNTSPNERQSRYKVNKEMLIKRDGMTQIEMMERRCQIFTQTHFNKYTSIRNFSVPRFKY